MSAFFIDTEGDYETRYQAGKFMEFSDNSDPLTSYFFNELVSLPEAGIWYVQGNEGRPEILSFKIFGDTQYWWVLLLYNGIVFPWYLPSKTILSYPSLNALESLYFSLKASNSRVNG